MKVLTLSPYIYFPTEKAFSKNSSGFGMMTYSILDAVSEKGADVYCLTHAITQGIQISGITFIKHTFPDIFRSIHFCDFIRHAVRILRRNAPARKKTSVAVLFAGRRLC